MAALARAGIPLGRGLSDLSADLPGKLGRIAAEVGDQIEAGVPLEQVLNDPQFPLTYRAVVTAGVRSGRLAVALEDVSSLIRRVMESRRMVIAAMIYPLILLTLAYCLFLFLLTIVFPQLFTAYDEMVPGDRFIGFVQWASQHAIFWAPWLPLVLLAALAGWWISSNKAWRKQGRFRLPEVRRHSMRRASVGNLLYAGRMATFAETLALLIDHEVPLPEAVCLAADASGDPGLQQAQQELAGRLREGATENRHLNSAVPAPLAWMLATAKDPVSLANSLRQASKAYRRRAKWMLHWLSVNLPMWLTVGIGGTTVLFYAVSVIAPWSHVLYALGKP